MPIAIVTGAGSGIGRASALALARSGFDVGVTWFGDGEGARDVVRAIEGLGRRADAREADLREPAAASGAIDALAEALGGIDVLVNNAGRGADAAFVDLTLEQWQDVLAVNLTGAFVCAQTAARRMIAQGRGGRIVNVTSVHEHLALEGAANYVAAKHGLGGMTKVAALELAEHGILVNAVAPGQIATPMTRQDEARPAPSDGIPLGRAGVVGEIAALVVFLSGEGSSYVTGSSFVADGGLSLIAARHQ